MKRVFVVLLALAGAVVIFLRPRVPHRHNVILISLDTLRADHLSCYGYERGTSPHIDALAREGILFEHAVTVMPLTAPAHASILTSLYPKEHGISSNLRNYQMDSNCVTLAQVFKRNGYRTAAIVQTPTLRKEIGLGSGFDLYREPYREGEGVRGDRVTDLCGKLLQEIGEPFFVFLNYFDCHSPYSPPEGYAERFLRTPIPEQERLKEVMTALLRKGVSPSPQDVQKLMALYDGEILFVDACVGRLIDHLQHAGLTDRTVIIVTADHGEGFEHDYFFDHGDRLYEPQIRVPLIIRSPEGGWSRGRRVPGTVSVLDIAPTCLELAGIGLPEGWRGQGRSLVARARGEAFPSAPVFSQVLYRKMTPQSKGSMLAVIAGGYKLITPADHKKRRILGPGQLYHLPSDPREEKDLAREEPATVRELSGLIGNWADRYWWTTPLPSESEDPPESGLDLDRETVDRLRSLGYM